MTEATRTTAARMSAKRRGLRAALALAVAAGTLAVAGPNAASAAPEDEVIPTPAVCNIEDYAIPEGVLAIFCLDIHLRGGSVKFGSIQSDIADPAPIKQVIGLGEGLTMVPIDTGAPGGGTPSFPTITVPGGIFGGVPLLENLQLGSLTGVSANIEPTGALTTGEVNIGALLGGVGDLTTANLPFRVKVNNLLLGSGCYIGTPQAPVNLNLGLELTENLQNDGGGLVSRLVASDTTFAIPAAQGCGPLGVPNVLSLLKLNPVNIFNSVINSKVGLPSATGNNHLTFADGFFTISADFYE